MQRGLYIAASGMVAEQMRQDQIANDLANASTPDYKADRITQRASADLLLSNTATGASVGSLTTGVAADRMVTDLAPQPLRETGEPLDLAIAGEGWFGVQTDQGVRYTRNGQFAAGAGGILTDQLGNPVLGRDGQPVRLRADGSLDSQVVGVFALTTAAKQGDNLYTGTAAGAAAGTVRPGAIADAAVYVTVRASERLEDFTANLRAPLVIAAGVGHQLLNQGDAAILRAPLFAELAAAAEQAA